MEESEFLGRLRSQERVVGAWRVPDELFRRVAEEESGILGAGGLPVHNVGMDDCASREDRFCVFMAPGGLTGVVRGTHSLVMKGRDGTVVGFDIPRGSEEWASRDDVMFISDDFVIFPDRICQGEMFMEVRSLEYRGDGGWIPESASPVICFPCATSSEILGRHFGVEVGRVSAGLVALNLSGTSRP